MTTPEQQLLNQHQFVSGAQVVTNSVQAIIQQGDISVPQLPSLPAHQQSARQESQFWLDKVWPAISVSSKNIVQYATMFQDTYKQLLDAGVAVLIDVLAETLLRELTDQKKSSDDVIALVNSFYGKFQPLYTQFQSDYTKAENIMTGNNQKLAELTSKKASLQADAEKLRYEMLIPFAGTYYAVEYQKVESEISSVSHQIQVINANLHSLQIVHDQLSGLESQTNKALTFSKAVSDGWQSLTANMTEVISHIRSVSPEEAATVIKIQLGAANRDWENVVNQASKLSW